MMIARPTLLLCGAFLLSIASTLLFATARADAPAPLDIVNGIYKGGNTTGMAFGLDPKERHQFFSKSTADLWDKADKISNPNGDEIGAIDFDITTNSQGADVKSFSITSNKIEDKAAIVVVKLVLDNWLRNSPDDDIIRYEFVLEDGRWLINDVGSNIDGKPWTLLGLLEINSRDRTRSKE